MIKFDIDFCNDQKQIVDVWKSVFGDSEQEILYFLDECKNKKCLGAFVNGKLVSMLFIVNCTYGRLKGKYIYAVSTLKEYRGNGIAGRLVEKAKEYADDFLWLIPAEESLIAYYKKFGFDIKLYSYTDYSNRIAFDESRNIIEYLHEGCQLEKPVGMVCTNNDFSVGDTGIIFKES